MSFSNVTKDIGKIVAQKLRESGVPDIDDLTRILWAYKTSFTGALTDFEISMAECDTDSRRQRVSSQLRICKLKNKHNECPKFRDFANSRGYEAHTLDIVALVILFIAHRRDIRKVRDSHETVVLAMVAAVEADSTYREFDETQKDRKLKQKLSHKDNVAETLSSFVDCDGFISIKKLKSEFVGIELTEEMQMYLDEHSDGDRIDAARLPDVAFGVCGVPKMLMWEKLQENKLYQKACGHREGVNEPSCKRPKPNPQPASAANQHEHTKACEKCKLRQCENTHMYHVNEQLQNENDDLRKRILQLEKSYFDVAQKWVTERILVPYNAGSGPEILQDIIQEKHDEASELEDIITKATGAFGKTAKREAESKIHSRAEKCIARVPMIQKYRTIMFEKYGVRTSGGMYLLRYTSGQPRVIAKHLKTLIARHGNLEGMSVVRPGQTQAGEVRMCPHDRWYGNCTELMDMFRANSPLRAERFVVADLDIVKIDREVGWFLVKNEDLHRMIADWNTRKF